jgi:hypothetical protein
MHQQHQQQLISPGGTVSSGGAEAGQTPGVSAGAPAAGLPPDSLQKDLHSYSEGRPDSVAPGLWDSVVVSTLGAGVLQCSMTQRLQHTLVPAKHGVRHVRHVWEMACCSQGDCSHMQMLEQGKAVSDSSAQRWVIEVPLRWSWLELHF